MSIDHKKIQERFEEIHGALKEIRRLTGVSDEEFFRHQEYLDAVKYNFLLAVEALGSTCVHVAARKCNKGVNAFGECFEILAENKILSAELAAQLQRLAKFRNKLIHQYWDIDDQRVVTYARENLGDFESFMREIGTVIKTENND